MPGPGGFLETCIRASSLSSCLHLWQAVGWMGSPSFRCSSPAILRPEKSGLLWRHPPFGLMVCCLLLGHCTWAHHCHHRRHRLHFAAMPAAVALRTVPITTVSSIATVLSVTIVLSVTTVFSVTTVLLVTTVLSITTRGRAVIPVSTSLSAWRGVSWVLRFSLGRWVCLSLRWSSSPWGWRRCGSPRQHRWHWWCLGLWWGSWLMRWWQWWWWSRWQRYRPYVDLARVCPQWRWLLLRFQQ